VGYEVFEAGQKFEAMEGTVLATGEAAGYTAGQLIGMADEIGQSSGNIGVATDAIRELAASGRFAGQDLRLVGQAATDMAQLTGQSIQSIVGQIEKLQEDPVKAVAKLNDQYHFLTVAQFEEIEAAQQSGDSMKAASIAYEAMADKMQGRTDELSTHVNVLIRGFRDMKQLWAESMQEMDHALGGGDDAFGLNEAKLLLATLEKQKKQAEEMGSSTLPGITLEIAAQQKKVDELTAKFHQQAQAAASVGEAAQKSAAQIDAMAKEHKGKGDHDKAQADRDAFNEQRLQHTMSLAEEKGYWQKKKEAATAGTQEYRQAVQQLLEIKSKEATGGREAARKEAEDARRSADVRISTEREVQAELQAEAKKQQQLSLEKLKASHDEAAGELANKRQQYQNEYVDGQISAQQLLQLEQNLVAQKLALDTKYLEDKKKLDAGDVLAVAKDNAAIVAAKQSAHGQMLTDEKQYMKNSQKEWQNHAKKIEGAMQSAVTAMLFQHQTLRQGVANIAMVIGEDFIQQAVMKPVDKWIEGEAQKIAASFSTQTTMQTQRAADSAAEAARGAASVVRAAGVAGAMGTASFAGAPWPVDMGAPAFGAGMAAVAASYAPMASAAGGWERVPIDGAMTELHKDEMVLPAHVANPIRDMAKKGGNGGQGGDHYHFNVMDMRSIADMARRNEHTFANVIKKAARNGRFNGRR
jgi:phage-related minor tail protein